MPFGSKHGSQNFQRLSDAVRHIMRQHEYVIINYCDDFIGFGMPEVAQRSYDCLFKILQKFGLTISQKKLVPPSTKVTCLRVLIDTKNATLSIPPKNYKKIAILFKNGPGKIHAEMCTSGLVVFEPDAPVTEGQLS